MLFLKMIGHGSVFISCKDCTILTDPWYLGEIFNESWELLFNPTISACDLEQVTHLWISHEHPDHLHFPTLRSIPEKYRARIVVLFQRHPQGEVIHALWKLGFATIIELPPATWYSVTPHVSVACFPSRRIDSALAIRGSQTTILNLNDCKIGPYYLRQIMKFVGNVDLLLTQYSIAGWIANSGTIPTEKRLKVIKRSALYSRQIQPRATVLFSSHAWFCHQENVHMNDWALTPDLAVKTFREIVGEESMVEALMPGELWSKNKGFTLNADRREFQNQCLAKKRQSIPRKHNSVPLNVILDVGNRYVSDMLGTYFRIRGRLPRDPVIFYVEDLGIAVKMNLRKGTVSSLQQDRADCHLGLHSQALWYCFAYRWGFDTLDTSGRFSVLQGPKSPPALKYCYDYSARANEWIQGTLLTLLKRHWAKRGEHIDRLLGTMP